MVLARLSAIWYVFGILIRFGGMDIRFSGTYIRYFGTYIRFLISKPLVESGLQGNFEQL